MEMMNTVFALGAKIAVLLAYRMGLRDGSALAKDEPLAKAKPAVRIVRVKKSKETDEARKARIEWENIERYGTDAPQEEVV